MKLFRRLKTFINLPFSTKALFIEALLISAWVKLTLKFFPFRKVMNWLGTSMQESDLNENSETLAIRRQVKSTLKLCKRYAFWPTECYTLSLTGKLLLKRRNINSTLYIGFLKNETGNYKGHAWLRANDTYISGYRESVGFKVHSIFS